MNYTLILNLDNKEGPQVAAPNFSPVTDTTDGSVGFYPEKYTYSPAAFWVNKDDLSSVHESKYFGRCLFFSSSRPGSKSAKLPRVTPVQIYINKHLSLKTPSSFHVPPVPH